MAIGLSILFGVRLPVNFNSPYKATSIIEFWRRWHMTLSRFLRDYLYIPLGGNKKGQIRRYINLILTMLLGGLWHGAGWTFIIWGALHGCYLAVNHIWRFIAQGFHWSVPKHLSKPASMLVTFICVMIAWVFFRASNTETALTILRSMFGAHSHIPVAQNLLFSDKLILVILLFVAWLFPNSLQIIGRYEIALGNSAIMTNVVPKWYQWRATSIHAILAGCMLAIALLGVLAVGDGAQFLYFEF